MNTARLETLFAYDRWATTRILDTATALSADQFLTPPAGYPIALRDILAHLLGSARVWRVRFERGESPEGVKADAFPTLAALRYAFETEQEAMQRYLATLDDAALDDTVQFHRRSGELSAPYVRWHVLMQLLMHGASHRSETAAILTAYDHSPGDLDFLVFLAEQSAG